MFVKLVADTMNGINCVKPDKTVYFTWPDWNCIGKLNRLINWNSCWLCPTYQTGLCPLSGERIYLWNLYQRKWAISIRLHCIFMHQVWCSLPVSFLLPIDRDSNWYFSFSKECFMSLTGVKGCPRCSRIEEKESRILVEPTPATTTEIRKFNPFMRSDERLPNSPSPSFL